MEPECPEPQRPARQQGHWRRRAVPHGGDPSSGIRSTTLARMAEPDVPPAEGDAELQRLRDAVRDLERDLALSRELLRRTTDRAAVNAEELTRTRRLLHRFRARRVIRLALRASSLGAPFVRSLRRVVTLPIRLVRRSRSRVVTSVRRRSLRASSAAERSLAEAVRRQLSRATVTSGPLVSIVIL